MKRRVLDVGNCSFDSMTLGGVLRTHWDVDITQAATIGEANTLLEEESFDLVFVNRIVEGDNRPGIELVERWAEHTSIVLLTNFPKVQADAIEKGALASFGKASLHGPATLATIGEVLAIGDSSSP